jgi:hypothetical protein
LRGGLVRDWLRGGLLLTLWSHEGSDRVRQRGQSRDGLPEGLVVGVAEHGEQIIQLGLGQLGGHYFRILAAREEDERAATRMRF